MEGLTSSTILEASVVSTKIGTSWGSVMKVYLMPNRTPRTIAPHLEPIGMQWLITVKKGDQKLNIGLRRIWIVYLSS